ncbi:permease [Dehalococcoidales bacterium]|nr:permease [Dehalococcoidales bacterium]
MEIVQFFIVFKDYLIELLPVLAIGFFLSGLIYGFVPSEWVERHLGGKGIKPILYCSVSGVILPICCYGVLPVAISLYHKGVKLGPVLAFLVAVPATSVTAFLVTWRILGLKFAVFEFLAVILMGIIIGIIGNSIIKFKPKIHSEAEIATDLVCGMNIDKKGSAKTIYKGEAYYFCSRHCQQTFEGSPEKYISGYKERVKGKAIAGFKQAFIEMPKRIGLWLVLGLILAALIETLAPVGKFVGHYLSTDLGYVFSLIFGLIMYICATGSVPLVDAFISQGMVIGAGMVLLLVGPVTNWGTILVVRKEFGGKILLTYLVVIGITALALGYCFSII